MKSEMRAKVLAAAVALPMSMGTVYAVAEGPSDGLGRPESFSAIGDTASGPRRYSPSLAKS
jgi:hypothetical protein